MKMNVFVWMTAGLVGLGSMSMSQGAVVYTGGTLIQDFTGYDGTAGPTGWDADGFSSGAGFSENRGPSSGGEGTGGTYAFDIGSGNIALGVQPGGSDFTPGFYELVVDNQTGAEISQWNVAFESYFFNDEDRGNSFDFSYSTNGVDYTNVVSAGFTSPELAATNPTWEVGAVYSDVILASVPSGSNLYLRWTGDDVSGGGSRDEFALDNVSVSAVPEPTTAGLLAVGFAGISIMRRRRKS